MKSGNGANEIVRRTKIRFLIIVSCLILIVVAFFAWDELQLVLPQQIPVLKNYAESFNRETSVLSFASFDGESGKVWTTSPVWSLSVDQKQKSAAEELVKDLAKTKGKNIRNTYNNGKWTKDMITYPVYSFCITNQSWSDTGTLYGFWSNGYLVFSNTSVYKCDIDFSGFLSATDTVFPAETIDSVRGQPMFSLLAEIQGWNTQYMLPSTFTMPECKEMTMEILSSAYEIKYSIQDTKYAFIHVENIGEAKWWYKWECYVEVNVDGKWYRAPFDPSVAVYPITGGLSTTLEPGETIEMGYDLRRYSSSVFGADGYAIGYRGKSWKDDLRVVIEIWDEDHNPYFIYGTFPDPES